MNVQRSKYINYRYSNYMQGGLAVLKIESSSKVSELTDNRITGKKDYNLYPTIVECTIPTLEVNLNSNKSNSALTKEQLNQSHDKEDKTLRTTKNYIGKTRYNVGHFFSNDHDRG